MALGRPLARSDDACPYAEPALRAAYELGLASGLAMMQVGWAWEYGGEIAARVAGADLPDVLDSGEEAQIARHVRDGALANRPDVLAAYRHGWCVGFARVYCYVA